MVFCLLFATLPVTEASAGYLRIEGRPEVVVGLDGDNVRISGTWTIANNGDEASRGVFPYLALGRWTWTGEPKEITNGHSERWEIRETFSRSKLECTSGDICSGLELPIEGAYPLVMRRHYESIAGYQYSASDVIPVKIGNLSGEALAAVRAPSLQARLQLNESNGIHTGKFEVFNNSQQEVTVAVSFHASREIRVRTTTQTIKVPPQGQASTPAVFENLKGLAGSEYVVFGVAQWQEAQIRNTAIEHAMLKVGLPTKAGDYALPLSVIAILLCLASLYFFVFRKSSRS